MPGVEKTYFLSNEADVARASAQHLVYPINMLLPETLPNSNLCIVGTNEVTGTSPRFDKKAPKPFWQPENAQKKKIDRHEVTMWTGLLAKEVEILKIPSLRKKGIKESIMAEDLTTIDKPSRVFDNQRTD